VKNNVNFTACFEILFSPRTPLHHARSRKRRSLVETDFLDQRDRGLPVVAVNEAATGSTSAASRVE
jgi:hypothetical protein